MLAGRITQPSPPLFAIFFVFFCFVPIFILGSNRAELPFACRVTIKFRIVDGGQITLLFCFVDTAVFPAVLEQTYVWAELDYFPCVTCNCRWHRRVVGGRRVPTWLLQCYNLFITVSVEVSSAVPHKVVILTLTATRPVYWYFTGSKVRAGVHQVSCHVIVWCN